MSDVCHGATTRTYAKLCPISAFWHGPSLQDTFSFGQRHFQIRFWSAWHILTKINQWKVASQLEPKNSCCFLVNRDVIIFWGRKKCQRQQKWWICSGLLKNKMLGGDLGIRVAGNLCDPPFHYCCLFPPVLYAELRQSSREGGGALVWLKLVWMWAGPPKGIKVLRLQKGTRTRSVCDASNSGLMFLQCKMTVTGDAAWRISQGEKLPRGLEEGQTWPKYRGPCLSVMGLWDFMRIPETSAQFWGKSCIRTIHTWQNVALWRPCWDRLGLKLCAQRKKKIGNFLAYLLHYKEEMTFCKSW